MDWQHQVATEWLAERKKVVTATELVALIPEYKRFRKAGGAKPLAFYALWEEKHSDSELDPASYGPAARGHIMEPYAVKDYVTNTGKEMYHWDDCIICNGYLGFSPDAMSIAQVTPDFSLQVQQGQMKGARYTYKELPKEIVEIKSYGIERHTKCVMSDKFSKQLEKERMQMAAAMLVLPELEKVTLLLYCPQAVHSFDLKEFTREELKEDIDLLQEVIDLWAVVDRHMNSLPIKMKAHQSEWDIYAKYCAERDNTFLL